jgi:hypothetical protein
MHRAGEEVLQLKSAYPDATAHAVTSPLEFWLASSSRPV